MILRVAGISQYIPVLGHTYIPQKQAQKHGSLPLQLITARALLVFSDDMSSLEPDLLLPNLPFSHVDHFSRNEFSDVVERASSRAARTALKGDSEN